MEPLEHYFDTAFAAPDGIQKLRELILTLAMQGKLVPQDPNDQPASELLKEIAAEKQRLVKEGKIKASKPLPEITPEEVPYELPDGWEWVRLGNVGDINPRNISADDEDAGFVPMPRIYSEYSSVHTFELRKWRDIKKGYTHFANGDVGLAKITPCFENAKSCIFQGLPNAIGAGTTELHIFRNTFGVIYAKFLLAYLKNPKYIATGISKMTGSAGQKRVPTGFFAQNPFPLPPVAEQHRIVDKIDELMARCDELENLRAEREEKRLAVHTAAITRLLEAQQRDSFTDAWQFITRHFGELYAVKENVAELRKAILQLAVMGKIVPQDPTDPPARELLKEIAAEKQRLVKEGKIKASKPLPEIKPEEVPYKLPEGWKWCRVWDVAQLITSGSRDWAKYLSDSGAIFVTMGNLSRGSYHLRTDSIRYVKPPKDGEGSRTKLEENDLLISITGDVGNLGLIPHNFGEAYINQHTCLLRFMPSCQNRYFPELMRSPLAKRQFDAPQRGIKNSFRLGDVGEMIIPLPPLPEQHRIVAKIDQLMALCDTLEEQIDAATDKQTALLNAVMAQV
ncbi:MAG TPA: restriction endonuclease subunit S [Armatimonadota bacterium]|nr:restriction endonuclease subunit S [Armatimonadota bacterium]